MKKAEKAAKPQSYLISDDKGLTLRIETEGKWIIVSSPFDPELVTQVKSIDEIFPMAYEVKQGLEAIRAEMAHNRDRGARFGATAAADAQVFENHQLRGEFLRFGIAAPQATERTTFKKHRRAHARPVFGGHALNIVNHAFLHQYRLCSPPRAARPRARMKKWRTRSGKHQTPAPVVPKSTRAVSRARAMPLALKRLAMSVPLMSTI